MRLGSVVSIGVVLLTIGAPSPCAAQEGRRPGWPSPVADMSSNSFLLLDILEYQDVADASGPRWDLIGWYGGDERRLWIKSEGEMDTTGVRRGEADVQVLYGRLITAWFDLQAGGRIAYRFGPGPDHMRVCAVIGVQGLAPYRFDIEPSLFISNKGKLSGRFTATYDLLQTQRLILQPRFETDLAAQEDRVFAVGRGINAAEAGIRLRFEVRREFAPYIGISYQYLSDTARNALEPGPSNRWRIAFGARLWH